MNYKLVILESPFADNEKLYIDYARAAVADSLGRGEAPIASHLLYTQPGILNDKIAEERAKGIAAGLAWLDKADQHVFYIDYGMSPGMNDAIRKSMRENRDIELRKIIKEKHMPNEKIKAGDRVRLIEPVGSYNRLKGFKWGEEVEVCGVLKMGLSVRKLGHKNRKVRGFVPFSAVQIISQPRGLRRYFHLLGAL